MGDCFDVVLRVLKTKKNWCKLVCKAPKLARRSSRHSKSPSLAASQNRPSRFQETRTPLTLFLATTFPSDIIMRPLILDPLNEDNRIYIVKSITSTNQVYGSDPIVYGISAAFSCIINISWCTRKPKRILHANEFEVSSSKKKPSCCPFRQLLLAFYLQEPTNSGILATPKLVWRWSTRVRRQYRPVGWGRVGCVAGNRCVAQDNNTHRGHVAGRSASTSPSTLHLQCAMPEIMQLLLLLLDSSSLCVWKKSSGEMRKLEEEKKFSYVDLTSK